VVQTEGRIVSMLSKPTLSQADVETLNMLLLTGRWDEHRLGEIMTLNKVGSVVLRNVQYSLPPKITEVVMPRLFPEYKRQYHSPDLLVDPPTDIRDWNPHSVRAQSQRRLLTRALSLLKSQGIEPAIVKGAAFQTLASGNYWRESNDSDLFFRDITDLWKAIRTLEANGFEADTLWIRRYYPGNGHTPATYTGQLNIYGWENGQQFCLDVHYGDFCITTTAGFSMQSIWEHGIRVPLDEVTALVPKTTDTLLLLVAHMMSHGYYTYKDLNDLAYIVTEWADEIDWSSVVSRADHYGLGSVLAYLLEIGSKRDGYSLPSNVKLPRPPAWMYRYFRPRGLSGPGRVAKAKFLYALDYHKRMGTGILTAVSRATRDAVDVFREEYAWREDLSSPLLQRLLLWLGARPIFSGGTLRAGTQVFLVRIDGLPVPNQIKFNQSLKQHHAAILEDTDHQFVAASLPGLNLFCSPTGVYIACPDPVITEDQVNRTIELVDSVPLQDVNLGQNPR